MKTIVIKDYIPFGALMAALIAFLIADARAATLFPANNGFEVPDQQTGFVYRPTGASWSFLANTGIAANGSAFNVSNAPNGNSDGTTSSNGQAAFFQAGDGSILGGSFSQSISGFQAGTASVSFLLESRGPFPMGQLLVMLDNTVLGTFSTSSSSAFVPEATISVPVTAGSHTLFFIPNGSNSIGEDGFVDSVSINNTAAGVPDVSSTWTLLLLGIGATFGLNLLPRKAMPGFSSISKKPANNNLMKRNLYAVNTAPKALRRPAGLSLGLALLVFATPALNIASAFIPHKQWVRTTRSRKRRPRLPI